MQPDLHEHPKNRPLDQYDINAPEEYAAFEHAAVGERDLDTEDALQNNIGTRVGCRATVFGLATP